MGSNPTLSSDIVNSEMQFVFLGGPGCDTPFNFRCLGCDTREEWIFPANSVKFMSEYCPGCSSLLWLLAPVSLPLAKTPNVGTFGVGYKRLRP